MMGLRFSCCSRSCRLVATVLVTWCVLLLSSEYFIVLKRAEVGASTQLAFASLAFTTKPKLLDPIRSRHSLLKVGSVRTDRHLTRKDGIKFQKVSRRRQSWRGSAENCDGRYVYMYNLPQQFNQELLEQCDRLSIWTNMCPHVANGGLGQPLNDPVLGLSSQAGWYATNQFAVELIFHESMKKYECLTQDPAVADAFYVPFYAGFEMSRHVGHKNLTLRDEAGQVLDKWLQEQVGWKAANGRNHFMVAGRITWDFMRNSNQASGWGNNLLLLPSIKNMSVLLIEAHPWQRNEHGIPYPTYFHPSKASDVADWQQRLRAYSRRQTLFSFIGGMKQKNPVRDKVIQECRKSSHCSMLECHGSTGGDCHNPHKVMKLFLNSVFCLQPRGDSLTRRSIFDSILAGCIPVFFTEHSAYSQYRWNLPKNSSSYSVFISESELTSDSRRLIIQQKLQSIRRKDVRRMQERVISTIPSIIYADPRFQGRTGFTDAFETIVRGFASELQNVATNK